MLEAHQATELEGQKHSQTNRAVFALWCEVCLKAKGTGAQERRQTNKELAKQEQYGPRIYSDFFYMCEEGVSTPMFKGNEPCTSYSRTFTIHNYGYGTAYTFTHNNITLEHNAMNNKNTIAHMDVHNTQY